ncbi:MarR family winged helix-turn-helix transcriptional regulator [Micromonospora orduensis]|uniref:MarR family winged helix-turn-helix transcriptional regulator n=1 Tax=Micromonospora orduensis TaxID=1420891 RepID=UPI0033CF5D8A
MTTTPDAVDRHIERWLPVVPELDADIEGAVVRMIHVTRHLRAVKERVLADLDLPAHEYDTLHALAGRGGRAAPSELAADLAVAPASITARVDTLLRREFVRRTPSTTDRRRVDVALTDAGRAAWRAAMEVQGDEEHRLLGALTPTERRHLSDLLRRVMLVAAQPADAPTTD